MMNQIINFFISKYGVDLSNTKVYFIALEDGKGGMYDSIEETVYINSDYNELSRELNLVHEFTHRMVHLKELVMPLVKEEEYCVNTTIQYVKEIFGEQGYALIKDLI